MMLDSRSILPLLAFMTIVSGQQLPECTVETVEACAAKLIEADHDVNAAVMPFLDKAEAMEHCSYYKEFEDCLMPIKPNCGIGDQLIFEGLEKAYQWWCDDLFDAYLDHHQCFSDVVLHQEAAKCELRYGLDINETLRLADEDKGAEAWQTYCGGSLRYLECVQQAIDDHCDDKFAGMWQRGLEERLYSPKLHYVYCVEDGYWNVRDGTDEFGEFPSVTVDDFKSGRTTTKRPVPTGVHDPTRCTQENLNYCSMQLTHAGHEVNQAIVPTLSEPVAKEHCSMYMDFEKCWKPAKNNCTLTDQLTYEGIELAYQWWCVDLFEEYIEFLPCFSNEELQREGEYCLKSMETQLVYAVDHDRASDPDFLITKVCLYIEHYLDCVENAVKHECPSSILPAKWQRGFDERSIEPLARGLQCVRDGRWVADNSPYPSVTINDVKGINDTSGERRLTTTSNMRPHEMNTKKDKERRLTTASNIRPPEMNNKKDKERRLTTTSNMRPHEMNTKKDKGKNALVPALVAVTVLLLLITVLVVIGIVLLRRKKQRLEARRQPTPPQPPPPYVMYGPRSDGVPASVDLGVAQANGRGAQAEAIPDKDPIPDAVLSGLPVYKQDDDKDTAAAGESDRQPPRPNEYDNVLYRTADSGDAGLASDISPEHQSVEDDEYLVASKDGKYQRF